ncbi:MAG: TraB/GumN family protein [Candidatus Methanoplasma sp.]|jgi:pheromone shutdown protein TraB|nr:TraB/GumN family protein [Candidatus Methanoplasma sp.]
MNSDINMNVCIHVCIVRSDETRPHHITLKRGDPPLPFSNLLCKNILFEKVLTAIMITMIGTGHVFNISEQVSFIVKHTWPDAVLIELDERRYAALMSGAGDRKGSENSPKLYRESAEYQNRLSERRGIHPGNDLLAAVTAGRMVEAEIICIDKDAEQTMKEVEEGMSFFERIRYSLSPTADRMLRRYRTNAANKDYIVDEETYVENMRRRFPTLVKKLIDERNVHMAAKIAQAAEKYNNMVVVVGDAHVRGICGLLGGIEIETIRLAEIMDQESMNKVRSRIWNRKAEVSE